jgi:AcrR family transcriptional regulator
MRPVTRLVEEPSMPDDPRDERPDGAVAVVRRAPFSDNPRVGARGQRTQQRILDAALRAFDEQGYHGCSIDRITKLARCSRVSFYQYFASKEDVFRQLAGQVARQVGVATEQLDPLTADDDGWAALRAWIGRFAGIHARYEPVFHAYEADDSLAAVAARVGDDIISRFHSRLATTMLPPRHLDPVIRLLLECLNHTLEVTGTFRKVVPEAYPEERVERALTDVMHRTLFGARTGVNVRPCTDASPPALDIGPEMLELLQQDDDAHRRDASGNRALTALIASGRDVFVDRGFHNTRVDDLVAAAGVSHGAFYRYFQNKEQLARVLTARALRTVGNVVLEFPEVSVRDGTDTVALRRWLRGYNAAQANEAAMLRVWLDAALQTPAFRAESAPLHDWGRRRVSRYLGPRGFGDVDMEAVVMVALLGVFGARLRSPAEVDAATYIIERGLLGR